MAKGKPMGTTKDEPIKIRWFWGSPAGEAGLHEQWPKYTQGKPKTQGVLPDLSLPRSDGFCVSQTGRLDHVSGGKHTQE